MHSAPNWIIHSNEQKTARLQPCRKFSGSCPTEEPQIVQPISEGLTLTRILQNRLMWNCYSSNPGLLIALHLNSLSPNRATPLVRSPFVQLPADGHSSPCQSTALTFRNGTKSLIVGETLPAEKYSANAVGPLFPACSRRAANNNQYDVVIVAERVMDLGKWA